MVPDIKCCNDIIRPLLACRYIREKVAPPPVLFSELMKMDLPYEIKREVLKLLEIKANSPEIGQGKRIDILNQYIEEELAIYKDYVSTLEDDRKVEWDELDR